MHGLPLYEQRDRLLHFDARIPNQQANPVWGPQKAPGLKRTGFIGQDTYIATLFFGLVVAAVLAQIMKSVLTYLAKRLAIRPATTFPKRPGKLLSCQGT